MSAARGTVTVLAVSAEAADALTRVLGDLGIEAVVSDAPAGGEEVTVYEVVDEDGLDSLPGGAGPEEGGVSPYLVYAEAGLPAGKVRALRAGGLVGVITPETSHEEVSFLVNSALFYTRVLGRNPRLSVELPVEFSIGGRSMKTHATTISRDGMFIVTLNPLEPGSLCDVSFEVPGTERKLATGARILYNIEINRDLKIISSPEDPFRRLVSHPGMAVFFTDLPEEDRDLIDDFIEGC